MFIKAVRFRNYRSLESAGLTDCSSLNVLIGKNNSGKSNVLSGIEFIFDHLGSERVAGDWDSPGRAADEFTNRNTELPISIGLEIGISEEINQRLRDMIKAETEGVDVAADRLSSHSTLALVVSATLAEGRLIRYVSDIGFGQLRLEEGDLEPTGQRLFCADRTVAVELSTRAQALEQRKQDARSVQRISGEPYIRDIWRGRERNRPSNRLSPKKGIPIIPSFSSHRACRESLQLS